VGKEGLAVWVSTGEGLNFKIGICVGEGLGVTGTVAVDGLASAWAVRVIATAV